MMNLRGLFSHAPATRTYAAGETILVEGEPKDVMYVILDGEVDIRRDGQSIDTAGPGELLGEMAMIDGHERSATAVAVVTERQFWFMVHETPHFALEVMRMLVGRLRRRM
jgi:CRP/FNR family cyclic AMP-dependent transcriptional regulator